MTRENGARLRETKLTRRVFVFEKGLEGTFENGNVLGTAEE